MHLPTSCHGIDKVIMVRRKKDVCHFSNTQNSHAKRGDRSVIKFPAEFILV